MVSSSCDLVTQLFRVQDNSVSKNTLARGGGMSISAQNDRIELFERKRTFLILEDNCCHLNRKRKNRRIDKNTNFMRRNLLCSSFEIYKISSKKLGIKLTRFGSATNVCCQNELQCNSSEFR